MADKKAIVSEINTSFEHNTPEDFLKHCEEDVEWTMAGDKTVTGKVALREWVASAPMEPPKINVAHTIADGDWVACTGDLTMNNDKGEAESYAFCDVYRFNGDKVASLTGFMVKSKPQS